MNEYQYQRLRANRQAPRAAGLFAALPEQRLLRDWAEAARRRQRLLDVLAAALGSAVDFDRVDLELVGTRLRVRSADPAVVRVLEGRRAALLRALRRSGLPVAALELTLTREGMA